MVRLSRRAKIRAAIISCVLGAVLLVTAFRDSLHDGDNGDLAQVRVMDFLNGEGVRGDSTAAFGGSLSHLWTPFNATSAIHRIARDTSLTMNTPYNRTNFHELIRRSRANWIAFNLIHNQPQLLNQLTNEDEQWPAVLQTIVDSHTTMLFPWLLPTFGSIRDMQQRFLNATDQSGIVITTGHWHFELAIHAILALQNVLNCTLPIEVFHAGVGDLSPDKISALQKLPRVTVVDIWDPFGTEATKIQGWAIKPFAILASRFRNVIFVDADALFFQDPARVILNDSPLFAKHGQLFFSDRTLGRGDAKWFKSINPHPTAFSKTLRYMNRKTSHEMESGVVAVDKSRADVLHALLLVAKMNSFQERQVLYEAVHGDKESFWFAWDILRIPYAFAPNFGGTVGYKDDTGICGGLFHTDENSKPFWWNGGVLKNKHASQESEFVTYDFAAFDSTGGSGVKWVWETPTTPFCLKPQNPNKEVVELSSREKEVGETYIALYKKMKRKGWEHFFASGEYRLNFEE
ncbi:hypothetical protein HDU98_001058 [Podochytrium sp. JEL0797]|nr:hypothetical protein HDU98_001058 [Podochytrium sp. JEL0797]